MLHSYVRVAVRNLLRSPLYSLLNIGGLALGIGCCLLISLYVHDEWSYDRFHQHAANIYRVIEKQNQSGELVDLAVTPGPLAPTLKKDFPEVIETARMGKWNGTFRYGNQFYEEPNLFFADNGLLRMFDFPLLAGNRATALTQPDQVVLTETTARKYFGANWRQNPRVIGSVIRLNNETNFSVAGILKDLPVNSHLQFDLLMSFSTLERIDDWSKKWDGGSYHTYVQLRPGPLGTSADGAAFEQKVSKQLQRYQASTDRLLSLQPLTRIHLFSKFAANSDWGKHGDIFYVRLFGAVGLIVLLIACVNFINLATARSARRAREVGVRKTVGAYRHHLIFQFLGESFLLTGLAVVVALGLASLLMPLFNQLSGKELSLNYSSLPFWVILLTLTLFVGLLAGLYPALLLSSFQPARVLKGVFQARAGRSFRQSLVVGQFALSLVLIISTIFIYNQLQYIQQKNLGFDKSQLLYVRMGGELKKKAAQFKESLLKQTSIEAATTTTSTLVDMVNSANINWEGQQPKDEFQITQMNVDPDFLKTVGMKLAQGSNFRLKAATDTNQTFLVNETAARRMGYTNQSAIGKRVDFWGKKGLITGVVRDFHFRPLNVPIEPFIFRYGPGDFYFQTLVKTRPGRAQEAIQAINQLYRMYEKESPLQYGFVDQELDSLYRREQRTGQVVFYFSSLAILISCLGLFGLAAYMAEQRTKEIGVRKVLGASVASIVSLLSSDFLKLVGFAILIASPIAWYAMDRWLQNFAYRIDLDWWVFAVAGLLAVGIALLTVGYQSVKAALANPVQSLRNE